MTSNKKIFYLLTALLLIGYFPILFFTEKLVFVYSIVWIFLSSLHFVYFFLIEKETIAEEHIFIILAAALLIRLLFLFSQPIGSDDIYRYMWDGKTQQAGINPYLYKPIDTELNHLHSDILPSQMNFQNMKTIYFPLSQWLFYVAYNLSGENVWAYKLLLFIAELLTLYFLFKILVRLNIGTKYLLIYALAPLPIVQFALDAHLDGFGLPLLLAFVYFYLNERNILASILLGLSFSIKPVGVLILPILFLREKKLINKLLLVTIPFIGFGIQFIPYIFTSNPFEAFLIYTKNWIYNGLVFNLLNSLIHNNQTTRLLCTILMCASLLPVYFSKKAFLDKIFFAIMILMIFSPVVHPWYIAWVLVIAVIARKTSGIYFAAAASFTSLTILSYKLSGIWKDFLLVQLIEYIPVVALLVFEFLYSKSEANQDQFVSSSKQTTP